MYRLYCSCLGKATLPCSVGGAQGVTLVISPLGGPLVDSDTRASRQLVLGKLGDTDQRWHRVWGQVELTTSSGRACLNHADRAGQEASPCAVRALTANIRECAMSL